MSKIISRYPKAKLESCGGGKQYGKYSHKNGCYLRLKDDDTEHSVDDVGMIILHFNKKNELIGIEFVDGLPYGKKK